MPEVEIRTAVLEDFQHLVALDHNYQTSYVWQMDRTFEEGQVSIFFREIRLPRSIKVEYPRNATTLLETLGQSKILVALVENQLVGYACMKEQQANHSVRISDLVVDPQARRQGIATALVLAAEEFAAQRKFRVVLLEMQSKNFPAIRLANKLGFEFSGYSDHYYSSQDIALFFSRLQR